ncbi:hypothetical protein [Azospirillum sp. SYSU D00513]|uniref:hypothetical protein n=1 Tax=Azospirillum sp. SYSU D00513 TaxID=2812561 RepID=UPI001A960087|nr:hypothetical protein [Azospirillum sp. SYSU D00513]
MAEGGLGLFVPEAERAGDGARTTGGELRALASSLRNGWQLLAGSAVAGLAAAVLMLHAITPQHTATMLVGPTARAGAAAGPRVPVSADAPPHSSGHHLAEPGPGDETLSDYTRYLELLASRPVAARLMSTDPDLARRLFPDRWDSERAAWRPPVGAGPALRRLFLALLGREDWLEPDAERVARALRDGMTVERVGTGPMRRVELRHPDRALAIGLLERAAKATDAHLRDEAARRSAVQIAHVKARMGGLTMEEHRRALADLLAHQERVSMMLEVDLPYAADLLEPPYAGDGPDWPDPLVIVPIAGFVGFVVGLLLVCLRAALRDSPPVPAPGPGLLT